MSTLKYVGTPAKWDAQPQRGQDLVDQDYINQLLSTNLTAPAVTAEIAADLVPYATTGYAATAMTNLATPAYLQAQADNYVAITEIDTASGPVGLNAIGQVPLGLVNAGSTQTWPSPFWSPGTYQATPVTATTTPVQLFTTAMPYPGYTYVLACFGSIDASVAADDGTFPEVLVRAGAPSTTFTGTVSYDHTGAGYSAAPGSSSATGSWSHTATAGAAVVTTVFVNANSGSSSFTSTATYGGVAMTPLGTVNANNSNNGWVEMFGALNVAGGAQTVAFNITRGGGGGTISCVAANSDSYVGALSFGTVVTSYGRNTSLSSGTIMTPPGGMAAQAFVVIGSSVPNGYNQTSRYSGTETSGGGGGGNSVSYILGDAVGSASFAATSSGNWASVAVPLTPAPVVGYAGAGQIIAFGYGCGEYYQTPSPGQVASQALLSTGFTTSAAYTTVTGLTAVNNGSYTSTMVGNFLQVPQSGTVTMVATFVFSGAAAGSKSSVSTSIQIIDSLSNVIVTGATVTGTSGTLTVSFTGPVVAGALYGVQIGESSSTFAIVTSGTFTISPSTVSNAASVNIIPVPFEDQTPLTGATTLYVMLASSNASTAVTASTFHPSLWICPIPWV